MRIFGGTQQVLLSTCCTCGNITIRALGSLLVRLLREILYDLWLIYPVSKVAFPLALHILLLPLQVIWEIIPLHMLIAYLHMTFTDECGVRGLVAFNVHSF